MLKLTLQEAALAELRAAHEVLSAQIRAALAEEPAHMTLQGSMTYQRDAAASAGWDILRGSGRGLHVHWRPALTAVPPKDPEARAAQIGADGATRTAALARYQALLEVGAGLRCYLRTPNGAEAYLLVVPAD